MDDVETPANRLARVVRTTTALFLAVVVLGGPVLAVHFAFSMAPVPLISSVRYEVGVSDPASGLAHVRLEVPAQDLEGRTTLTLAFPGLTGRPEGLRSIAAFSGSGPLSVTRSGAGGKPSIGIDLRGATGTVVAEYTVDPTYYPPGREVTDPADAVSRITRDLAVIRTTSIAPMLAPSARQARVDFRLPPGWEAVTPWARDGEGYVVSLDGSGVDYVALGPFDVREISAGGSSLRIATLPGTRGFSSEDILSLVQYEVDLMGPPPRSPGGARTVIVVPPGFMNGGAAGPASTVQTPSGVTLAHEVFHWWNSGSSVRPEAEWFHEGFTEYYGIKVARETGIAAEEAAQCLADLNGEARFLEGAQPRSLADLSRQMQDSRSRRLVYSKGALLGYHLDTDLAARGRSLDEVVRMALTSGRRPMGNDVLKDLFNRAYGGAVDGAFDAYILRGEALPDLGLKEATGRSGCARYLPDR